jgi:RNA polymerase sigma-70 factor, ECF subfamily
MRPPSDDFVTCVGVFDAEFDYVYHVLRRYGVAVSDAEDLVQEVFLVMWRRWEQYDATRPIRPWLAGIAFRVAYNHRQRAAREVPGGLLDLEDARPGPEERLATDHARSLVWRVLDSLPEKHRALILSHDVDGIPVREIADAIGVPVPTAHTRLRAARKAFGKAWKQQQTVAATRARLAPLLQAQGAPAADGPDARVLEARRRAVARARRLVLLPGFGLGAGPRTPTPAPIAPLTPGLAPAWLPVGGAGLFGGVGLLLVLVFGGSEGLSAGLRSAPSMSVASAQAAERAAPMPARPPFAPASPTFVPLPPARPPAGTAALGKGLLGYWRFDEPYGSPAARDLSGNGNDCLLRRLDPAGAWTEGRLGGAILLNGDGWLECPQVEALSRLGSEMTISVWLRRLGTQQHVRALVSQQYGSGNLDNFHFGFRDDELWMRTRFRGQVTLAAFPRQRGLWHHLSVTLEAGGRTRLYIDGEEVMQRRRDGQPPLGGGSNPLIVGGGANRSDSSIVNERFHGVVDELSIYGRRLDAAEIRALAGGAQPSLSL